MNFERVTRLGRAVPSLRTARRFIGEDAQAVELVTRHFVSDGLQSAGIEGARHSITSVGAAIQE